ncbi:hypothetical protein Fcan01_22676 [Folsomia candida]|uniref:Uncharacterized protein n=1 Tax=Folsomia candida TaxID=158441 RepID=A0A226DCU0_FOLCA|nr:hypothetical protein Fcan01_22676 [Folsomia candida]
MCDGNSATEIKRFKFASVIHDFTLFLSAFYPILNFVWLYLYTFLDEANVSKPVPVWATVQNMYYFVLYVTLGSLHHLLHFRSSELKVLLETTTWMEKICLKGGAGNYLSWKFYGVMGTMKFSLFAVPLMNGIVGVNKPCEPPSMLGEFLPRCDNPGAVVAILNGLLQAEIFYIYAAVVVTTLVHLIVYPSLMIQLWIEGISKQIQDSQVRSILTMLQQYRVAQVTENLVNAVMGKPYLLIFLTFATMGQICSQYIILTSWSHLPIGIMVLFLLFLLNFCIMILFLHPLCYPNIVSTKFIKNLRGSKSAGNAMLNVLFSRPTSYLSLMGWLLKWGTRSCAIPVIFHGNSLAEIRRFESASAIHDFTLFLSFVYPTVNFVWLYVYTFVDEAHISKPGPVWVTVMNMSFLVSYVTLGSLQHLLHLRGSEVNLLLRTTTWMEKTCVEKGAGNYMLWKFYGVMIAMKFSLFALPLMGGIVGAYKPCEPPSMLGEFLPRCENLDAFVTMILVALGNGLLQAEMFYIYAAVVITTLAYLIVYPALMIQLWISGIGRIDLLEKLRIRRNYATASCRRNLLTLRGEVETDSGVVSQKLFHFSKSSILHGWRKYRVVQVTENLVNAVMGKPYLLIFLTFATMGQICSQYIILTSWSQLPVGMMFTSSHNTNPDDEEVMDADDDGETTILSKIQKVPSKGILGRLNGGPNLTTQRVH